MRRRGRIALIAVAALAGAGLILFLLSGRWTPSRASYPVQGIDVSHHQGAIDWSALPEQGVDFAYIKATEGGDHRDRLFAANWQAAGAAGIRRGAYHFFTLCRPGMDQAANVIATVPRDPDMMPIAVDLEYLGNCSSRAVSQDQLHAELATFIRLVEAHFGKPVMLYLTREFDETYKVSANVNRPLWLRRLVFEPAWTERPWTIWQVSNFRRLRGIDGRVDWNVWTS
jgi:lysozyme